MCSGQMADKRSYHVHVGTLLRGSPLLVRLGRIAERAQSVCGEGVVFVEHVPVEQLQRDLGGLLGRVLEEAVALKLQASSEP